MRFQGSGEPLGIMIREIGRKNEKPHPVFRRVGLFLIIVQSVARGCEIISIAELCSAEEIISHSPADWHQPPLVYCVKFISETSNPGTLDPPGWRHS